MPWEPKKREPKIDVTIHLDRWVLLAPDLKYGKDWLAERFVLMAIKQRCHIVAPIFDPTDVFEVIIHTEDTRLEGVQFYEVIDCRARINILHEEIVGKSLANITQTYARHRSKNVLVHPHPSPEEKDRDRLDLCRRWIAPDPFDDMREHDEHGLSDVSLRLDTPEWLCRRR